MPHEKKALETHTTSLSLYTHSPHAFTHTHTQSLSHSLPSCNANLSPFFIFSPVFHPSFSLTLSSSHTRTHTLSLSLTHTTHTLSLSFVEGWTLVRTADNRLEGMHDNDVESDGFHVEHREEEDEDELLRVVVVWLHACNNNDVLFCRKKKWLKFVFVHEFVIDLISPSLSLSSKQYSKWFDSSPFKKRSCQREKKCDK